MYLLKASTLQNNDTLMWLATKIAISQLNTNGFENLSALLKNRYPRGFSCGWIDWLKMTWQSDFVFHSQVQVQFRKQLTFHLTLIKCSGHVRNCKNTSSAAVVRFKWKYLLSTYMYMPVKWTCDTNFWNKNFSTEYWENRFWQHYSWWIMTFNAQVS